MDISSHRRINIKVPVEFRPNYGRMNEKAILKNISLTGAFLDFSKAKFIATENLRTKDKIIIFFSVSDRARKVTSSIVWRNERGCGVQFHPGNKQDFQIVDDFIFFMRLQKQKKKKLFLSLLNKVNSL